MRLMTLGALRLEESNLQRPKPLLLVAYLALSGPASKQNLLELFFRESKDPADALATTVKRLRDHGHFVTEHEGRLECLVTCDAVMFLAYARDRRYEEALRLYRGPFLDGLSLEISFELEEWLVVKREQLASTARSAHLSLAEAALLNGNVSSAQEHAETALQLPGAPLLDERAARRLRHLLKRTNSEYLPRLESEVAELCLLPPHDALSQVRLPGDTTAFVGRHSELSDITEALTKPGCRLLTLIGPGGIGKTRLALEAAQWLAPHYTDGVVFVELASVGADVLLSTLARALDLPLHGRESPTAQIVSHLREKSLLLVLDNFEHLIPDIAFLVDLLVGAPGVDLLVTSRESLDLHSEWLHDIEGLPFPPPDALDIESFDAVQLFIHSARRQNASFRLESQGSQVSRICRLVQGMPLALELASSWARLLSFEEIADEIEKGLGFLATTARDLPERHRSLKAVFESTWQLLSQEERRNLGCISLFRGGFSREAAEVVADAALATLLRFVNKSLVQRTEAGRYSLHEVVRWFAFEKLTASPEENAAYDRFEDYYASFLRAREDQLRGSEQGQALDEISDEMDNIRLAWARCAARGRGTSLENMLQSLYHFFVLRSRLLEGEQVFSQAAAALSPSVSESADTNIRRAYAKVVSRQAYCSFYLDRYEMAGALLMNSLAIFDALGEQREAAIGYSYLGHIARHQGNFSDANVMYEKSLVLFRTLDNPRSVAVALNDLAEFLWLEGEVGAARALYEEGLPVFESLGDQNAVAHVQRSLGRCAAAQGDIEGANALYEQSLTTHRALNNPNAVANTLRHIGLLHLQLGEYTDASRNLQKSLQDFRALSERNGTALVLADLAEVSLAHGNHQDAETSYQEALAIAREIGNGRLETDVIAKLGNVKLLMGDTATAKQLLEESLNIAEKLNYTQGVAYAHQRQGYLAYSCGHHEEAKRRFEESYALYHDKNILRGKAVALAGLGQVAVTHEPQKAAEYFYNALTTSVQGRTDVVTLSVLVAVAAFLQTQGQKEQALECLALPLHHPAATHETRNEAERLEAVLIAELPADVQSKAPKKDEDLCLINAVSRATGILKATFKPL